jgi:hypothetical protein
MIEIILSHWATYLLLAWVAVIVIVNLWPRKKPAPPNVAPFTARRTERVSAAKSSDDQLELAHRE